MRRSDDELRALWQGAVRGGEIGPGDAAGGDPATGQPCPDADHLAAALRGEGSQEERERLADHLVRCAACAALAREHRELGRWAGEATARPTVEDDEALRPDRPYRESVRRAAVAAAGIAVAVLAAYGLWFVDFPVEPGARTGGPADVQRSATAVQPASGAVLPTAPGLLTWPDEPGATGYRVQLYDERAEPVWTSPPVGDPRLPLPPEIRARLAPGTSWSWSVEVQGPARRGELGPYWFRVEGEGTAGAGERP